jgi:hypothetical protein
MSPHPSICRVLRSASVVFASALSVTACAPVTPPVSQGPATQSSYRMPPAASAARAPDALRTDRAAELAEGALYLLDPARPGGPDYAGSVRLSLMAAELASSPAESDLRLACHRAAARAALRSGDSKLYIEAVDRWESASGRAERAAGELAIHTAIRARLKGQPLPVEPNDPRLRELLGIAPVPEAAAAVRKEQP